MRIDTRTLLCVLTVAGMNIAGADTPPPAPAAPPAATPGATPGTNAPGPAPHIAFATPVYDFGRIKCGDVVKYTFAFTNTGEQTLEVTHVQPSCGCTAAGEWTRRVEPGQIGNVPVQFNSANFNGQVFKTVSVTSNDKQQPTVVLQLKGTIWKPIELAPPYTILTIPPDAEGGSATVKVINNTEDPLGVFDPKCSNPAFTVQLQTNTAGKEFQLTITAVPPLNPGSLQGKVTLHTTATNSPTLDVPFWANVQPALMALPQQVVLPPAPLASKNSPSITIQNNSTNLLSLSEPAINLDGVEVQLKEMQPGKIFSAMLAFPQGFELPSGQQGLFTVKTSNPHFPQIKVPIMQLPRPAVPPTIPTSVPQPPTGGSPAGTPPAAAPTAKATN